MSVTEPFAFRHLVNMGYTIYNSKLEIEEMFLGNKKWW